MAVANSPLSAFATAAIHGYRRWISPRKGWHCAHASLRGGPSCSAYALERLNARPLHLALADLRERFRACARAASAASEEDDGTRPAISEEPIRGKGPRANDVGEAEECLDSCIGGGGGAVAGEGCGWGTGFLGEYFCRSR